MKVKRSDDSVNVFIGENDDKLVMDIENTGNGFIAHFHSFTSIKQDNFICMDYSEAAYMLAALKKFKKEFEK